MKIDLQQLQSLMAVYKNMGDEESKRLFSSRLEYFFTRNGSAFIDNILVEERPFYLCRFSEWVTRMEKIEGKRKSYYMVRAMLEGKIYEP